MVALDQTLRFTFVDVFSDRPLGGNQLAVFTDATGIDESLLQPLAREVGFVSTVFVYPPDDEGADARVRIFTPAVEIPFGGQPVLGAAVVLGQPRGASAVTLQTAVGPIPVRLEGQRGRLQAPVPTVAPFTGDERALLDALCVTRSELPIEAYDNGMRLLYVILPDEAAVAALSPDLRALVAASAGACVGCVAPAGDRWRLRVFAPALGIDEDIASGSGVGPLTVHLARHGRVAFGRDVTFSQGAELGRPSTLHAAAYGTPGDVRAVEVAGDAVVVAEGAFVL